MTPADIQNEAQAAMKLSRCGHKNIVSVLKCGHLSNSPYFFLDMIVCDLNLEDYILRGWPAGIAESMTSIAPGLSIVQMRAIMLDICSGVAFMHRQQYVHRDLKPRNGIFPKVLISSALFSPGCRLEGRRLWSYNGRVVERDNH